MMHKLLRTRMICRAPDEPPAGAAPATPPTEAPPTPAPSTPAPSTEPPPIPPVEPPAVVPVAAVQDERKKRQAVEGENHQLREQLAYFQGMQAATTVPPTPPTQPAAPAGPPAEPKVEDFESFEEYQQADRKYIIDVATYNATQTMMKTTSQQKQQEAQVATIQTFKQRLDKAAETDPDISVIANTFHLPGPNHIPLVPVLQEAIIDSDVGPQLLRYFADNKNEATRLANLTPAGALREIGRIEAKLSAPPPPAPTPPPVISMAPEPITPIGGLGLGGSTTELKDLPMAEFFAKRAPEITRRR